LTQARRASRPISGIDGAPDCAGQKVSVAAGIVRGMGKVKRLFACSTCGRPSGQWAGRCAACGEWGTVAEQAVGTAKVAHTGVAPPLEDLSPRAEEHRLGTGFTGVDRVLGGGLVPGSAVLVAGAPGIGKSTLLLQLASRLNDAGHPCLVASGEESRGQVALRARRLGLNGAGLSFVPGRELADVLAAVEGVRPAVVVVDSVHTVRDGGSDAIAGGPGQVRACVDALVGAAKRLGVTMLLVGHVTKAGDLAGPRTIEHAVDVVLSFDGEPRSGLRVLSGGKNRFGPEGEVAWFEMRPNGLIEQDSAPGLLAGDREPGCATALIRAGRRALAVDVQALVIPTEGPARRQAAGLDPRRFHIVAAVAERATGERLVRSELIGATAGGMRVEDPAADLAIAAALVSAGRGVCIPAGVAFAGEVSLTGAIRPVGALGQRISVASAAGIRTLVCATLDARSWSASRGEHAAAGAGGRLSMRAPDPGSREAAGDVRVHPVAHLREALTWAIGHPKTVRQRSWTSAQEVAVR
jgi:DNA repair protein RadA/Sms